MRNGASSEPVIVNLMFDPKIREGQAVSTYADDLAVSFISAAQLQSNFAAKGAKDNPEVVFWGKISDIKKEKIDPNKSFRGRKVDGRPIGRLNMPKLLSVGLEDIHKEKVKDSEGRIIEGLEQKKIPVEYRHRYRKRRTEVTLYENKDLYHLSSHALKHGLVSEEQKGVVDDLIEKIDPESKSYMDQVGLVSDVKRAAVLFLEQKVFKGGSHYLDIDMAERLKDYDSRHYTLPSQEGAPLPEFYNPTGKENNVLFARDKHTDPDKIYTRTIQGYHKELTAPLQGQRLESEVGDMYMKYYRKAANPLVSEKPRQGQKDDLFFTRSLAANRAMSWRDQTSRSP